MHKVFALILVGLLVGVQSRRACTRMRACARRASAARSIRATVRRADSRSVRGRPAARCQSRQLRAARSRAHRAGSSAFSGVGIVACTADSGIQTSTAFLVGAFDIGVSVAHTFEDRHSGVRTDRLRVHECRLARADPRAHPGFVRQVAMGHRSGRLRPARQGRRSVRLSEPSRYAQKTMPLGRFTGVTAPVIMVGTRATSVGRPASARRAAWRTSAAWNGVSVARFTHDMDSRGIAPGAPVIDERTGMIIGIHTLLPAQANGRRNGIITMNDWLESTLRTEIQLKKAADSGNSGSGFACPTTLPCATAPPTAAAPSSSPARASAPSPDSGLPQSRRHLVAHAADLLPGISSPRKTSAARPGAAASTTVTAGSERNRIAATTRSRS